MEKSGHNLRDFSSNLSSRRKSFSSTGWDCEPKPLYGFFHHWWRLNSPQDFHFIAHIFHVKTFFLFSFFFFFFFSIIFLFPCTNWIAILAFKRFHSLKRHLLRRRRKPSHSYYHETRKMSRKIDAEWNWVSWRISFIIFFYTTLTLTWCRSAEGWSNFWTKSISLPVRGAIESTLHTSKLISIQSFRQRALEDIKCQNWKSKFWTDSIWSAGVFWFRQSRASHNSKWMLMMRREFECIL